MPVNRKATSRISAAAALVALAWAGPGSSQLQRDFIFDDEHGHLILRFVGLSDGELNDHQRSEVVNAEFSEMVHDRIRADLLFAAEPRDPANADALQNHLLRQFDWHGQDFLPPVVECRSASCRIVVEHHSRPGIDAHQAWLDDFQAMLQRIIDTQAETFSGEMLLAAYNKQGYVPHLKAFIRIAGHGS